MFPINPIPYIIPFIMIFFLLPWTILVIKLINIILSIYGSNEKKKIISFKESIKIKKSQPEFINRHKNVMKWFFITIISWLVGFFSLALILYFMESNNLIINHSKGIYKPNVQQEIISK